MTQTFEEMLYLFGCGARGFKWQPNIKINMEELRKLAISQNIWQVIYPVIKSHPEAIKYQEEFLYSISSAIRRKEFNLSVIRELETQGIKCCILKGAVVSELYSEPDCRISGDTDIIIDPLEERKVAEFLRTKGYITPHRAENDHHMRAQHKIGGVLEVHIRLSSIPTEKVLFNGMDIYSREYIKDDKIGCHKLNINDNLMHLTAHYIHHFVNGGGGVRQMMDLLLYMEAYKEQIDLEKYNKLLKELRYDKLIAVVKSIGTKYFGFNYELVSEELMNKVLDDTEKGGIFGHTAGDRGGFYQEFCKLRTEKSKIAHSVFMATKAEKTLLRQLFPTQKKLIKSGFAYAKYKALIPIAWGHKLFNAVLRRYRKELPKNDHTDRLEMMRSLDIIN